MQDLATQDFLAAIGLAIMIEGVLYALFPGFMKRMMAQVLSQPENQTRMAGLFAACMGVGLVWLIRG
jgi:uncharacterized protein YjeT (DUF2065 family)